MVYDERTSTLVVVGDAVCGADGAVSLTVSVWKLEANEMQLKVAAGKAKVGQWSMAVLCSSSLLAFAVGTCCMSVPAHNWGWLLQQHGNVGQVCLPTCHAWCTPGS